MPYFAAAVERRDNPSLSGTPLVIYTPGGSERIFAISDETASVGVRAGMTLRQAQILCPQARSIIAAPSRYQRALDDFREVLTSFTFRLELGDPQPAAIGYLDLGHLGRARLIETARRIGQTVRSKAGLATAIGLAGGKFPAYVAANSLEPNKALLVTAGHEAVFLAHFPVDLLPMDKEMARRLHLLGIQTLGQLAALSAGAVSTQFGRQGRLLHQLARGHDNRPVSPYRQAEMECISRQFDSPVANRVSLEAIVQAMATELAGRLRSRGLMGRELRLILHLEDATAQEERLVMRRPTGDSTRLANVLKELMARVEVDQGITNLEIILADLAPARGEQLDLFVHQTQQENRLNHVLKDLVARHGDNCFYHVSLPEQQAHLPERRFRLLQMEVP